VVGASCDRGGVDEHRREVRAVGGAREGERDGAPVLVGEAGEDVAGPGGRRGGADDLVRTALDVVEPEQAQQLRGGGPAQVVRLVQVPQVTDRRRVVGLQGVDALQTQLRTSGGVRPDP
jgi:hypothetical protein